MFGSYQPETERINFQLKYSIEFKSHYYIHVLQALNTTPPHQANCPHPVGLPTLKHQQQLPSLESLRVKANEVAAVCQ